MAFSCTAGPECSTSIIGEHNIPVDMRDYRPVLLGVDTEEICFHIYNRYRQVKSINRKRLIPLVHAEYIRDTETANRIRESIVKEVAGLIYDLIYTTYCVATNSFKRNDLKKLECVYLSDIKPYGETYKFFS